MDRPTSSAGNYGTTANAFGRPRFDQFPPRQTSIAPVSSVAAAHDLIGEYEPESDQDYSGGSHDFNPPYGHDPFRGGSEADKVTPKSEVRVYGRGTFHFNFLWSNSRILIR